jgi:ABC-type polysaccharide/polyol phosphate export permease
LVDTRNISSFVESWTVQRRVVAALLLREILTRYGRHNIGFLWLFVEPMLFTLGVTALWTFTKSIHGSDLPITAFAITGYSSVLLWRNMPGRCIGAIKPNLSLMYHRHVKVMDVLLARLLLEGAGATISFVVLSIVFISIGWLKPPEDLLQVMGGWMILAWFGMSLALLLAALAEDSETVDKLWHPTSYLLFPLSGAAFLVDALPEPAQRIVLYLPMVNATEFLREGYFGSMFHARYDMTYAIIVCASLTFLGLAQLRKVSREVIPE